MNSFNALTLAFSSLTILRFFQRLGVVGVFLFSVLDSSFLVLPFGNDLLLIGLISSDRQGLSWIGYVLAAVVGSVIGTLLVDLPLRTTGEKGLEHFLNKARVTRLKKRIDEKAGLTILLATALPPPFPFTPVIMTAAALQYPRSKLLCIVAVGRLVRYLVEAILALYLGRRLIRYINSEVFTYIVYGVIAVALVASLFSVLKWLTSKRGRGRQAAV